MSSTPAAPDGGSPDQLLSEIQWVHALAAGLVRDDSRAADAAQDALLAALKNPPTGNVRAWFSKVLRYRHWNQLRTDKNRRSREATAARPEALPSTSEVMERAETQRRLVEAVFGLRDPYRTTVILRYFEGLSTEQVATQQGVEPATVRSRLRRGLEQLRTQLDDDYGDRKTWCLALAPLVLMHDQAVAAAASAAASTVATVTTTSAAAATTVTATTTTTTGSAMSGALWGGLIMSTKTVTAAAVAVVLLVGIAVVWQTSENEAKRTDVADGTNPLAATSESGVGNGDDPTSDANATAEPMMASTTALPAAEESALAAAPIEKGSAKISGKVTNDSGQPLDGMVVHAVPSTTLPEFADGQLPFGIALSGVDVPEVDDPTNRAITDRRGEFVFDELADGTYAVVVRGPGYRQHVERQIVAKADADQRVQVQLALGYSIEGIVVDPHGVPVEGAEVSVNGGMHIHSDNEMSFVISIGDDDPSGEVKTTTDRNGRFVLDGLGSGNQTLSARHDLWASGTLTEVAAGSSNVEIQLREGTPIAGVVIDPAGKPVANAEVSVNRQFGRRLASTTTDKDGNFQIEQVTPGSARLHVTASDWPVYREELKIAEGEPITDLVVQLSEATSVVGVVHDATGQPIAGASVRLRIENSHETGLTVETDETGKFQVDGVAVGEPYECRIKNSGYLTEKLDPFVATAGENNLGTIAMAAGGTVRGIVTDEGARFVEDARVSLRRVSGEDAMAGMFIEMTEMDFDFGMGRSDSSGADGVFEIDAIAPGTYQVRVRCNGYRSYKGDEITVANDQTLDIGTLVLEQGFAISGFVLDPQGQPVAGASVSASAGFPDFQPKRAKTDANGEFEIAGLEDKAYKVTAKGATYAPASAKDVSAGTMDLSLKLQRTASIAGVVLDAATGQPVPAFGVKLAPKSGNFDIGSFSLDSISRLSTSGDVHQFTDASGAFQIDGFDPGDYTLEVTADGFVAHEEPLKLRSGEEATVEIQLDQGGAIEGYVRDSDGKPIRGASIARVEPDRKKESKRTMTFGMTMSLGGADDDGAVTMISSFGDDRGLVTDENGYYLLPGVPPGKVDLKITHSKYLDAKLEGLEVVRGVTHKAEVAVLKRGGKIHGVVYNEAGEPAQMATVQIYPVVDGERGKPEFTMTNGVGEYSQEGLAAGEYAIEVQVIKMDAEGGGGAAIVRAGAGSESDSDEEPAAVVTLTEGQVLEQDLRAN